MWITESELQKVKDLLDMGFIHDEEYERRIKEILGDGNRRLKNLKFEINLFKFKLIIYSLSTNSSCL
jgi:hypothetical protein